MVPESHNAMRASLLAGCIAASLLIGLVLLRYHSPGGAAKSQVILGLVAIFVILALAAWLARWGTRPKTPAANYALRNGSAIGCALGLLWIIEISFNNFVPPAISTGAARAVVDNLFWGAIILGTIGGSIIGASRARNVFVGLRIGFWSGLVSGLLSCLMGLLLIVLWMPLLLRDPLLIAEFAARGPMSDAPDLAAYVAYETMAGAIGHLILLGIIMGSLCGLLGGLVGRTFALVLRRRPAAS